MKMNSSDLTKWSLSIRQKIDLTQTLALSNDEAPSFFFSVELAIRDSYLPNGNSPVAIDKLDNIIRTCDQLIQQLSELPEIHKRSQPYGITNAIQAVLAVSKNHKRASEVTSVNKTLHLFKFFADKETLRMAQNYDFSASNPKVKTSEWDAERFEYPRLFGITNPKESWERVVQSYKSDEGETVSCDLKKDDEDYGELADLEYRLNLAADEIEVVEAIKNTAAKEKKHYKKYRKLDLLTYLLFEPFNSICYIDEKNKPLTKRRLSYSANSLFVRYLYIVLSSVLPSPPDPETLRQSLKKSEWFQFQYKNRRRRELNQ